jgi:uronate dehydrogenase
VYIKNILLTGAAGALGRALRPSLRQGFQTLRLSDIVPVDDLEGGEMFVACDLRDRSAVETLVEGTDAIVHLGGSLSRDDWDSICGVNIAGTFNLYEAARRTNVFRIIFASSNHVIGMYPREQHLDLDVPLRPDSLYGVSKCFGESLSRYYWDKFGIETACLRIGSALPEPNDERSLATWISIEDLEQAVMRCLTVPHLGWTALYGVSDNDRSWWDNRKAGYLGFAPESNSEDHATRVLRDAKPPDPQDPALLFQGGSRSAHDFVREQDRPLNRRFGQSKP